MSHSTWREAAAHIVRATDPRTQRQADLALAAGECFGDALPKLVAAARLQSLLASPMGLPTAGEATDSERKLIGRLKRTCDGDLEAPRDSREAQAWIKHLGLRRRLESLHDLKLIRGDIVEDKELANPQSEEVASIGRDGRVHFRGGAGAGAWPDRLVVRCRTGDDSPSADHWREKARNNAELRKQRRPWSQENREQLVEFCVTDPLEQEDVDNLQVVIEHATDEAPIQDYVKRHPHILAALLPGPERFCIEKPRLGAECVPDFLLAHVDSIGVHWMLVELETPIAGVTIKADGTQLDKHARAGVSQIQSWRQWLQDNISYARGRISENGRGLVGIRPTAPGLVLVGRRPHLKHPGTTVRNQHMEQQGIQIHTYDWLIERLRGLLTFDGPPGANPYHISAAHEDRQ